MLYRSNATGDKSKSNLNNSPAFVLAAGCIYHRRVCICRPTCSSRRRRCVGSTTSGRFRFHRFGCCCSAAPLQPLHQLPAPPRHPPPPTPKTPATPKALSTLGTLFFGGLCAATLGLGCWQSARYFEKVDQMKVREDELRAPPVDMTRFTATATDSSSNDGNSSKDNDGDDASDKQASSSSSSSSSSFRRLATRGTFDHGREVLVGPPRSAAGGAVVHGSRQRTKFRRHVLRSAGLLRRHPSAHCWCKYRC